MPDHTPSFPADPAHLLAFEARLSASAPEGADLSALLSALERTGDLERAYRLLKQHHPLASVRDPAWRVVHRAFQVRVDLRRQRRMGEWQHDPRRRTLRFRLEVRSPATRLNPGALQAALSRTLEAGGLPLALGLEKTPKPVVRLGHPLPPGVEGLSEWAEAVLSAPSPISLARLPEHLAPHAPEGLHILDAQELPNHASPVLELSARSRWRWTCPEALHAAALPRLDAFLQAATFQIEKTGKVAGHKAVKRVEVRHLVLEAAWEGPILRFTTRIAPGEALNPARLLGGIFGLDPAKVEGLMRESVELAEDPRLQRPDKYEPKLSNLYEDAVLLQGGPSLTLVDEDDEEPLVLGS